MPLPWALRGLRDGVVTTDWPRRDDAYQAEFPAVVQVDHSAGTRPQRVRLLETGLDHLCPSGALLATDDDIRLDRGRCIGCGRCVDAAPDVFSWAHSASTAELTRGRLVVPRLVEDEETLARIRAQLAARVGRLGRSVHIRHVDAGSDGSEEWEVQALLNPVYDVHRLGIFFTASPKHADILLVTGVGTPGMSAPLLRTREAMPEPVVVIAAGTDAISGGLFASGYSTRDGVGSFLEIDVWVPGSPPSPFSLLHGILLALGRIPAQTKGRR
ncbi:MAG: ferredoxin [Propionibacteriaceae bacterium]|nr:ferredoxin [Propionibacteriaceae bacterium]